EDLRVVLLAVTEGEDKPLKYPKMFKTADLVLVTKIDLADAAGFDRSAALANVHDIAPQAEVLEVSARTGGGMAAWYAYREGRAPRGDAWRRPGRRAGPRPRAGAGRRLPAVRVPPGPPARPGRLGVQRLPGRPAARRGRPGRAAPARPPPGLRGAAGRRGGRRTRSSRRAAPASPSAPARPQKARAWRASRPTGPPAPPAWPT